MWFSLIFNAAHHLKEGLFFVQKGGSTTEYSASAFRGRFGRPRWKRLRGTELERLFQFGTAGVP